MKVQTIEKGTGNAFNEPSFKKAISPFKNILYFFYADDQCLYIGQTKHSLFDRCYKNTPRHSKTARFSQANYVHIIQLDDNIDDIARKAIEGVFIATIRPKQNKQ